MQDGCDPSNLKRGPGGTVDIEFAVQMLQLAHCRNHPDVLQPGTLKAIEKLHEAGIVDRDEADFLGDKYQFLRSVESGLRLMNTTARHDLPKEPLQLERLAFLLQESSGAALVTLVRMVRKQVRQKVEQLFQLDSTNP